MDNVKLCKERKMRDKAELEKLTKEELIAKLISVEAHNFQLKKIIAKTQVTEKLTQTLKQQKSFDFSRVPNFRATFRHILLRFYYLGWDYHGFVTQENTIKTIEHYLFDALLKTCLIKDRESCNYNRCGRTDKGVSSYGQVISLTVRSKLSEVDKNDTNSEINYCKLLNRILPKTIQCISWSPAPESFSARFNCNSRTYRYFFPKGNLDIDEMKSSLQYFIGGHDFRNFCKMDVGNGVVCFVRNISEIRIDRVANECSENSPYDMYQLVIKGRSFLWHQIRCIVAVLFLIGEKREPPEIIKHLLDVGANPRKPDYNLAMDFPLNLFNCEYEIDNWVYDHTAIFDVISTLQELWTNLSVKTSMTKIMLNDLEAKYSAQHFEGNISNDSLTNSLVQGVRAKVYKPLMKRQRCDALEDKIDHYVKRGKLIVSSSTDETNSK